MRGKQKKRLISAVMVCGGFVALSLGAVAADSEDYVIPVAACVVGSISMLIGSICFEEDGSENSNNNGDPDLDDYFRD